MRGGLLPSLRGFRTQNPHISMKRSTRLLITAAAMAGLYAGAFASRTLAADTTAGTSDQSKTDAGKHSCKGQNSCKGQGNCSAGDNGCAGKNSCKGKGGCASKDDSGKKSTEMLILS
jgi:hypothetical protein